MNIDEIFNKILEEKYYYMKKIGEEKGYSQELIIMMTLIYMVFYKIYGKSCDYPLYDLFCNVNIYYENGTVLDIVKKYKLADNVLDNSCAITILKPNYKVFENSNLKQFPQVIVLGTEVHGYIASNILKLEMFLHEIRHTLMGYFNTNVLLDNKKLYVRSGVKEIFITKTGDGDNDYTSEIRGVSLDEVLNTYCTEFLVNEILKMKKYNIKNVEIKKYLNTLRTSCNGRYYSMGYGEMIDLVNPILCEGDVFLGLVHKHEFDGDIEVIKKYINDNSEYCNYDEFCLYLDEAFIILKKFKTYNSIDDEDLEKLNKIKEIILDMSKKMKCNRYLK